MILLPHGVFGIFVERFEVLGHLQLMINWCVVSAPHYVVAVTEQASGEAYTTHPSRTRGQVRQPVAGSAPKGDTKALLGL